MKKTLVLLILGFSIMSMGFVPIKYSRQLTYKDNKNLSISGADATPGPGAKEFSITVYGDPSDEGRNIAVTIVFNGEDPVPANQHVYYVTVGSDGIGFADFQTSFDVSQTDVVSYTP